MILKIISWNADTLTSPRLEELKNIEFDIFAIVEHQLKNVPYTPGFLFFQIHADLCILVKDSLEFQIIESKCSKKHEMPMIVMKTLEYIIYFPYVRDGQSSSIEKLLNQLKSHHESDKVIIMGDLNCRSRLTNAVNTNKAGRRLDTFFDSTDNFHLLDHECNTFFRPNRGSSYLDYIIVSSNVSTSVYDYYAPDWFDSDHRPIILELSIEQKKLHLKSSNQYPVEFKITDKPEKLMQLKLEVEHYCSNEKRSKELNKPMSLTGLTNFVTTMGLSLRFAKLSRRKVTPIEAFPSEIVLKLKHRRSIDRLSNPDEYAFAKQDCQRSIRNFRQEKFLKFARSIPWQTSSKRIWGSFQRARGKIRSLSDSDLQRQAQKISNGFKYNYIPTLPKSVVQKMDFLINFSNNSWTYEQSEFITFEETKVAITKLNGGSSPGPDGIPGSVIKLLPDAMILKISECFNTLIFSEISKCKMDSIQGLNPNLERKVSSILNKIYLDFPNEAIEGIQIPIPKNQNEDRPIVKRNVITKLLDLIMKERFDARADKLLPDWQFGFRHRRGSADQAIRVITHTQLKQREGYHTCIIFFDIRKAFDRIDREILITKMIKDGFPDYLIFYFLRSLNSYIRLFKQGFYSEYYYPEEGSPQGCPSSPSIWNYYFKNIVCGLAEDSNTLFGAIADDLAVVITSKSKSHLETRCQHIIDTINNNALRDRIEFNVTKLKYLIIPKKVRGYKAPKTIFPQFKLTIHDQRGLCDIARASSYKYLGVIIDDRLTFTDCFNMILTNVKRRLGFVKFITRAGKMSRKLIETFFKAYVRGYINYFCYFMPLFPSKGERLITLEKEGLRMCCGALRSTPIDQLYEESTMRSPKQQHAYLMCRKVVSYVTLPQLHLMADLLPWPPPKKNRQFKTLLECYIIQWKNHNLPSHLPESFQDASALLGDCRSLWPPDFDHKFIYWGNFWQERQLAYIRMDTLPTRRLLFKMKYTSSNLCRHCNLFEETKSHLFFNCSALSYPVEFQGKSYEWLRELLLSRGAMFDSQGNATAFHLSKKKLLSKLLCFLQKVNIWLSSFTDVIED